MYTHFKTGESNLFKEKRLCFDGPESKSWAVQGAEFVAEGGKKLGKLLAWTTGETAVAAGKLAAAIPTGIVQGVGDAWEAHAPTKQEAWDFIMKAGEFFKNAPLIGDSVTRYYESLDKNKRNDVLKMIVDQGNWIPLYLDDASRKAILEDEPLDAKMITDANPAMSEGQKTVLNFLATCKKEARQGFFMEQAEKSLAKNAFKGTALDSIDGVFNSQLRPADKYAEIEKQGKAGDIAAAFGAVNGIGIEGLEAKNKGAFDVAKNSLSEYYKDRGSSFSATSVNDYENIRRLQQVGPAGAALDKTVEGLMSAAPAGKFRAALQMDVLTPDRLAKLQERVERIDHEKSLTIASTERAYEKLNGEASLNIRNEGKTFRDTFDNMSGGGKILLGVVLFLAARKYKFVQHLGFAAAALYFGRMFLLHDDTPGATISGWVDKGVKKISDKTNSVFSLEEGTIMNNMMRAKVVTDFLPKGDNERIAVQAQGLGALTDVPLSLIGKSFVGSGPDGMDCWKLDMSKGLGEKMDQIYDKKGLKKDYKTFFTNCMPIVAEGVAFALYRLAIKNPAHADKKNAVDEGLALMPSEKLKNPMYFEKAAKGELKDSAGNPITYSEEEKTILLRAARAFADLLAIGRNEAAGQGNKTMGEFLMEEAGIEMKNNAVKEAPAIQFEKKKQQVMEFFNKDSKTKATFGGVFTIKLEGGEVKYFAGSVAVEPSVIGVTDVKNFNSIDPSKFFTSYERWLTLPVDKRPKDPTKV